MSRVPKFGIGEGERSLGDVDRREGRTGEAMGQPKKSKKNNN